MAFSTSTAGNFSSPAGELVPAEAKASILRKGQDFFRNSQNIGSTVDRDGLNNIHALEARPYDGGDDTPEQKTNLAAIYGVATWGLVAAALAVTYFAG